MAKTTGYGYMIQDGETVPVVSYPRNTEGENKVSGQQPMGDYPPMYPIDGIVEDMQTKSLIEQLRQQLADEAARREALTVALAEAGTSLWRVRTMPCPDIYDYARDAHDRALEVLRAYTTMSGEPK